MPGRAEQANATEPGKGSEDAMLRCTELEADLAELRAAYDLYFQGVERLPPHKKHDLFKKSYQKLKGTSVRQTAVKFRVETIGQKLLTYERLWDRTLKEIEAGTYRRDLARLKRKGSHGEKRKQEGGADHDFDVDEDLDLSDLDEGADDLSAALAAAEAAVAKPVTPAVPSIRPVAVTPPGGVKVAPAITPVTPAGGVRVPAVTPAGGVKPAVTPPGVKPSLPVITPAGGIPVVKPAGQPTRAPTASGSVPAVAAVAGPRPAVTPARPPVTGSNPALKPAPALGARPSAPVGGDGGLSDTKIKAIYDAYVMAKKRCGEDTRAVTLDSVSSSLKKQVPELMKQHNAKSVEFKVVIKDGKAVLRALPKE